MNLSELIRKAKELYLVVKNPASNWLTRFQALLEFAQFVYPSVVDLFNAPMEMSAPGDPVTVEQALVELEECCKTCEATEGYAANGELLKKLFAFFKLIVPLIITVI
jgi:hypothetical protein